MKGRLVIKYGGHALQDPESSISVFSDIKRLKQQSYQVVLVHGGGPRISSMLKNLGVKSEYHRGLRITDKSTMEITEMVLSGGVNKELVGLGQKMGIKTVGISGRDAGLILAGKMDVEEACIDLGRVGGILEVNIEILELLLSKGYLPIISPVSGDGEGLSLNINADHAAGALAAALKAERIIFLTDVKGVMDGKPGRGSSEKRIFKTLSADQARKLITEGIIRDGMLPKVKTCLETLQQGVKKAQIIDGKRPQSLLQALTGNDTGTMIVK